MASFLGHRAWAGRMRKKFVEPIFMDITRINSEDREGLRSWLCVAGSFSPGEFASPGCSRASKSCRVSSIPTPRRPTSPPRSLLRRRSLHQKTLHAGCLRGALVPPQQSQEQSPQVRQQSSAANTSAAKSERRGRTKERSSARRRARSPTSTWKVFDKDLRGTSEYWRSASWM
eukprot:6184061-Pleurochrysis_carterae.AAC.1